MKSEQIIDATNYSKLAVSVPQDVANERLRAFFKEVSEARQKHQIADVYIVIRQNVETENGEAPGFSTMQLGDESHAMQMCSYAMGVSTAEHNKFVLNARSSGIKLGAEIATKQAQQYRNDLFGGGE